MNDAHLHMVVNHFPIIGTILGFGILVGGIFLKSKAIKNTAYCLFIVCAVSAFASMATGEGAEDMIKKMPDIGMKVIHQHEEWAEKLALSLYLLAIISVLGIYTNVKNHAKANLVAYVAATVVVIAIIFAQQTGTSGGEVRHTEIRDGYINPEK